MFGSKKEMDYDGIGAEANAGPGIYLVSIKDIEYEPASTTEDGKAIKARIKFHFNIKGVIDKVADVSSSEGSAHTHIEYEVRQDEPNSDSKAANLVKRVGHILSKFIPKEQLEQHSESFDDYAKWVMAKVAQKPYAGKNFKLMVTGSVWQRNANSRCPNYPPFIARENDKLAFDKNGIKGNAEYVAHMRAAAGDQEAVNAVGGDATSDFE